MVVSDTVHARTVPSLITRSEIRFQNSCEDSRRYHSFQAFPQQKPQSSANHEIKRPITRSSKSPELKEKSDDNEISEYEGIRAFRQQNPAVRSKAGRRGIR